MKRSFHLGLAVFSVVSYSSSLAASPQIVYGLQHAKHFNGPTKNDVYIQAGSFVEQPKASHYQRILKSKTMHSVEIVSKGNVYSVLIGPLHSPAEIRKTAMSLLRNSKAIPQVVKRTPFKPVHAKHIETTPETYKESQLPSITRSHMHSSIILTKPPMITEPQSTAHWFVGVGAGAQFPTSLDKMLVNNGSGLPAPYNQDSYGVNNDSGAVFSLSGGRRWERDSYWLPMYSFGISWQHYFNTEAGDTIMQYSDPKFLNYNYSWNLKSDLLLGTAKINIVQYGQWSPYINGGIGGAYVNTSGYSETALSGVTPRVSPGFASNTSTQFAYQVGTGVDLQVTPQIMLSLGYNYQNLGSLSSGPGVGTWSSSTLNSGSYGSNEILVSMNYLFGK